MTVKKTTSKVGKNHAGHKGHPAKATAARDHVLRGRTGAYNVAPESGKVIGRTVATHRDALKRLADR